MLDVSKPTLCGAHSSDYSNPCTWNLTAPIMWVVETWRHTMISLKFISGEFSWAYLVTFVRFSSVWCDLKILVMWFQYKRLAVNSGAQIAIPPMVNVPPSVTVNGSQPPPYHEQLQQQCTTTEFVSPPAYDTLAPPVYEKWSHNYSIFIMYILRSFSDKPLNDVYCHR
jgi:hypothetical protein